MDTVSTYHWLIWNERLQEVVCVYEGEYVDAVVQARSKDPDQVPITVPEFLKRARKAGYTATRIAKQLELPSIAKLAESALVTSTAMYQWAKAEEGTKQARTFDLILMGLMYEREVPHNP